MSASKMLARLAREEHEPLTPDLEAELGDKLRIAIEDSDEIAEKRIREELIFRHMRLVVHIGKRYTKIFENDWDEIMASGNLALTQAMMRWHPDKGQAYPWAERWITTGLNKAADAQRTIRIPNGVAYKAGKAQKQINDLEAVLARPLTEQERADVMGTTIGFEDLPLVTDSLDREIGRESASATGGETRTLGESIEDEGADPADQVELSAMIASVRKAIEELNEIEKEVIMIRFGIDNRKRMTLAELGEIHGVTGEAMRRIETAALAKLRHPALKHPIDQER
jgi:RNA polymerase sigma factor (sigma-70 family)